jgi:hypothetical protein
VTPDVTQVTVVAGECLPELIVKAVAEPATLRPVCPHTNSLHRSSIQIHMESLSC